MYGKTLSSSGNYAIPSRISLSFYRISLCFESRCDVYLYLLFVVMQFDITHLHSFHSLVFLGELKSFVCSFRKKGWVGGLYTLSIAVVNTLWMTSSSNKARTGWSNLVEWSDIKKLRIGYFFSTADWQPSAEKGSHSKFSCRNTVCICNWWHNALRHLLQP